MKPTFASHLDAFGQWRLETDARLAALARFAREHDLLDDGSAEWFEAMRRRLSGEKLMVAFVAEFSRGKSELINAIFFSDKGRRMMPASAGRTTMCPVELGYDAQDPVGLSLLPIETRLEATSLAEYRVQPKAWTWHVLDLANPDEMAKALAEVMRTRLVSPEQATALGFWDAERPADNPPLSADGQVEVPVWRHARINLPHPLLKRGLVVLDTPGLNAIGTEPELTLGLLPQAHATVFILGADTGVTKSDLDIWRDHLSGPALARYVVLNKIDTLADPLSTPEQAAWPRRSRSRPRTCSRFRRVRRWPPGSVATPKVSGKAGWRRSSTPCPKACCPAAETTWPRHPGWAPSSSISSSPAVSARCAACTPTNCTSCAACAARARARSS